VLGADAKDENYKTRRFRLKIIGIIWYNAQFLVGVLIIHPACFSTIKPFQLQ